jgi:protein NrfC
VNQDRQLLSRREFVELSGCAVVGVGVAGCRTPLAVLADGVSATPVAGGYLLTDTKKCAGCLSCMLACSLAHEGRASLALSRIAVVQSPFGRFPDDLVVGQCRQCVDPPCHHACPVVPKALYIDTEHGNIRTVDRDRCISCMACVEACPYTPKRVVYNFEDEHAQKCDLCADAPYWQQSGGVGGRQACVEVCPVRALKYSEQVPEQEGDEGYVVNLRNRSWGKLGFPVD